MNVRDGPDDCGFLECFVNEFESRNELIPLLAALGDTRSEVELVFDLLLPGGQSADFPIYDPMGETRLAYVAACSLRGNRVHFKLVSFPDPVLKTEALRSHADNGSGVCFYVPYGGHNPAVLASPSIPWKLIEGDDPPDWADVERTVSSGDIKLVLGLPKIPLAGIEMVSTPVEISHSLRVVSFRDNTIYFSRAD